MNPTTVLWLSLGAAALAVLYGIFTVRWVLAQPAGNARMQEVRNRNWISDTLFNGLSNLGYAFTPVALPGMPAVAAYSKKNAVTTDFVYMRFLGDRIHCEEMLARSLGEVAFTETVTDRSDELGTWATWIEEFTKKNVSVYVYINNHYSGFAPRDIDDLKGKLGLQVLAPNAPQQSALEF
jgi:uncharacterized protein YecE (DUF72 family)